LHYAWARRRRTLGKTTAIVQLRRGYEFECIRTSYGYDSRRSDSRSGLRDVVRLSRIHDGKRKAQRIASHSVYFCVPFGGAWLSIHWHRLRLSILAFQSGIGNQLSFDTEAGTSNSLSSFSLPSIWHLHAPCMLVSRGCRTIEDTSRRRLGVANPEAWLAVRWAPSREAERRRLVARISAGQSAIVTVLEQMVRMRNE
jgi:hypothetical protein